MAQRTLVVLFDLDGTLVDTIDLIVQSARHAFASRPGPAPTDTQLRGGIGRPLIAQFEPFLAGPGDMDWLIANYREYQMEHHDRLTNAYDGIPGALGAIAELGSPMGVVTSKIEALAHRALRHTGIDIHMQVVVGYESTSRHKPEPEPVLLALERMGADAGEAVYVGDSPYDIEAGVRAGVTAVGVSWGPYPARVLEDAGASRILHRPDELPGAVREIAARPPNRRVPPVPGSNHSPGSTI